MSTLLIVHHSPAPLLQEVLSHALKGANDPALGGVDVKVVEVLDATVNDPTSADAILLGTSANFGYISGTLKHFFGTTFREAQEVTKGLPFSCWIRGGFDATGAENATKTITTGYRWELAVELIVFVGSLNDDIPDRLVDLGDTMAAQILG